MTHTICIIPARMASQRLPGKPLAEINGRPMITHVIDRAKEANIGEVYVACSEEEVKQAVESYNCIAIMTDPDHPSGSDRINEALHHIENHQIIENIICVQGDLPTLDPTLITKATALLSNPETDIATLGTPITDETEKQNPNVVKIALSAEAEASKGRAIYFSRATIPANEGPLYHHIGLYAYKRTSLETFVSLPQSPLEKREKLEQLRALENGMRIDVAIVNATPLGVDTEEDLIKAREELTAS